MDLGPRINPFTPYGPWSTVALAAAVFLGSTMAAWALMLLVGAAPDTGAVNDTAFAASVVGNLIGIAAIAKLADLRAPGQAVPYLALVRFESPAAWRWIGIGALLFASEGILEQVLRTALDMPAPPTWLDKASPSVMLVLAVVAAGPVFEELMFRGFVMEGLAPTRLGQSGALVLSTLAWTLLHSQYDMISLFMVFGLGMLFGLARLASGSLLLPMLLHITWNAFSLLFTFA
jgi:membrane protease YdiL (CAAX protease family)